MTPTGIGRFEAVLGLLLIGGWLLDTGHCFFYPDERTLAASSVQTPAEQVAASSTATNFIADKERARGGPIDGSAASSYSQPTSAPEQASPSSPPSPSLAPWSTAQSSPSQEATSSNAFRQEQLGQTEVTPSAEQVAAAAAAETKVNEVRETELEAIAAVEASIGFGSELFGSSLSAEQCYDEYGNARYCEPPFENIAFERPVKVSSECGSPPARFCTAHNDQVRNCHICNAQNPKKRHPAAYLNDLNNPSEPTCWVSAPISAPSAANDTGESRLDNVSLELNFNKQYEIIYVNLQFCSLKPDSLAIYKSLDYGKSWLPYQLYSSQCARVYGVAPSEARATRPGQVQCINASQSGSATRIAFSPLEGVGGSVERADWISASDIRISLDKHQPAWIYSHLRPGGELDSPAKSGSIVGAAAADEEEPLTSPSDTFSYAVADLTVGARCKCNGHASRCVHARDGQLECDCRHNTAGRDCDKCAPFHFDRPWAPATQLDANPCQPCNCNGHSRKCHFDQDLYRLSGKRSGGVCMGCRDNTDGRFCHYCKEGFTRDHSKPMTDKEACKHCNCHPIGSLGKVCNQTTGQCPCKEGVVGLQCSRCAAGYQQSRSLTEPCIKLPENENDINYYPPEASVVATQAEPQAVSGVEVQLPGGSQRGAQSRQPAATKFANDVNTNDMDSAPAPDKDDESSDAMGDSIAMRKRPKNGHKLSGRPGRPSVDYDMPNRIRKPSQISDFYPSAGDEPFGINNKDFDYYPARYFRPSWQPMESVYNGARKKAPNRYMLHAGALSNYGPPASGTDDDPASNSDMITNAEYPILQSYHPRDYNGINHAVSTNWAHPRGRDYGHEDSLDSSLEAVCNDCGKKTRRLSQRKFCQADYAIRAKVLIWQVGDDWTRLVVEILDIFKSPLLMVSGGTKSVSSSNELAQSAAARFQDNLLKPDDAPLLNDTYELAPSQQADSSSQTSKRPHRLLIGSKQSIWIPSEDFQCKCPSLIVGVDYLLLGPLDSQRGVFSLQLDRHGVATRWNTMSHQPKLMRYQRNQERGKCAPRL